MTDAQIRLYQMQLEGAEQRIAELEHELEKCQFCYDKTRE